MGGVHYVRHAAIPHRRIHRQCYGRDVRDNIRIHHDRRLYTQRCGVSAPRHSLLAHHDPVDRRSRHSLLHHSRPAIPRRQRQREGLLGRDDRPHTHKDAPAPVDQLTRHLDNIHNTHGSMCLLLLYRGDVVLRLYKLFDDNMCDRRIRHPQHIDRILQLPSHRVYRSSLLLPLRHKLHAAVHDMHEAAH